MEEYHRLDCLSAIQQVVDNTYPGIKAELRFTERKEISFEWKRYPGRFVFEFSDYLDIDTVPAELFSVQVSYALSGTPITYSPRVREFFESSLFRETALPIWLKRHRADRYLGQFDGFDVFTADIYNEYTMSTIFKVVLVDSESDIEEYIPKARKNARKMERLFSEMRNVAVCD